MAQRTKTMQQTDEEAQKIIRLMANGLEVCNWTLDSDGDLYLNKKLYAPATCREKVLKEFHDSRSVIYPGSTKRYCELARKYMWQGMKQDVAKFVSCCLIYR